LPEGHLLLKSTYAWQCDVKPHSSHLELSGS